MEQDEAHGHGNDVDHGLRAVTETNSGGFIAVCNCGWLSNVHPTPKSRKSGTADAAKLAAQESHAAHQRAQRRASA